MAIKRIVGALLTLCFACWATAGALAAEGNPEDFPWKNWEFSLGGYLMTNDSSVSLNSATLGVGTDIDMENDLGFDKTLQTIRFDADWRFLPRHRASFSYYQYSRDAVRVIDRDIQFGDETFLLGTTVASEFDIAVYKASYAYSVIHNAKFDLGLSAGLHVMDFKVNISSTAGGQSESGDLLAPLPVFGLRATWAITPKLFLKGNVDVFAISIDDISGRFTDALVALEYNAFEHVGVGIGYNRVFMHVEATDGDFNGEADAGFGALLLYGKYFF